MQNLEDKAVYVGVNGKITQLSVEKVQGYRQTIENGNLGEETGHDEGIGYGEESFGQRDDGTGQAKEVIGKNG